MKVLVLGTSGLDLLARPLRRALAAQRPEVCFGPYGNWQGPLLQSPPDEPPPDLVLVVLDADDLADSWIAAPGRLSHEAEGFTKTIFAALERGLETHPSSHFAITTLFPPQGHLWGMLADNAATSPDDVVDAFNRDLRRWAAPEPRVSVLGLHRLMARQGRAALRDERLWLHARCRWSRPGLEAIAEAVARLWEALRGGARKALVLDLDNTLWGGLAVDDGASGVVLGHEGLGLAYREFQLGLRRLRERGVLLAIASKNDEDAVWALIDEHPDMVLGRGDFAAWRIDWNDKASNVEGMAEELSLGLDALVFVDDNPAERERVSRALPQVAVPDWPDDVSGLPGLAEQLAERYFPAVALVGEDLVKTEQYQAQSARRAARENAESVEDYLHSLAMTCRVHEPSSAHLPRFAQLTQKTNQFNVLTRRYSEAELAENAGQRDRIVLGVSLDDRFGANGIVGLAMAREVEATLWSVDNFLLSCRVIGRSLERSLFAALTRGIRQRGGRRLEASYRPTGRNQVVRRLWSDLGLDETGDGSWSLDLTAELPEENPYIRMET